MKRAKLRQRWEFYYNLRALTRLGSPSDLLERTSDVGHPLSVSLSLPLYLP